MDKLNETISSDVGQLTRRYAWLEDRYYYVHEKSGMYYWGPTAEEVYARGFEVAERGFLNTVRKEDGKRLGR